MDKNTYTPPDINEDDDSYNVVDLAEVREQGSSQVDYFASVDEPVRCNLPDGVSYVSIRVLNEGERQAYQNKTKSKVKMQKSGAEIALSPGTERRALLTAAIVGWNLVRGVNKMPVAFNERNLNIFIDNTAPSIIDKIEVAIRKANPWLLGDIPVEELRRQIEELSEMVDIKEAEEAGKSY